MAAIDTIKEVLKANMDIDPEKITEATTFEDLGLDSLDLVEMICEIEERLGIDFGDPEGLVTVGDVAAYLETL